MASLSTTRPVVVATLNNNNSSHSQSPQQLNNNTPIKPQIPTTRTIPRMKGIRIKPQRSRLQQHLKFIEIERALGAGSYRDSEPKEARLGKDSITKGLMTGLGGESEGPVQKQIRETGQWVAKETEGIFNSHGKRMLVFSFQWAMPIYLLMMLVAAGVIKLPFSTTLLDDLLM